MTLLKSSGSGQGLMKGTEQRGSMARYTGLQSVAAFFLKSGSMGCAEGGGQVEKQVGERE